MNAPERVGNGKLFRGMATAFNKRGGMFDSQIWEQWNFERKLDQAPVL